MEIEPGQNSAKFSAGSANCLKLLPGTFFTGYWLFNVTLHSLASSPDSCNLELTPSEMRMWQNPTSCIDITLFRGQHSGPHKTLQSVDNNKAYILVSLVNEHVHHKKVAGMMCNTMSKG